MAAINMLEHLAAAYAARDDVAFAKALTVSYREGTSWGALKQELSSVSSSDWSRSPSLDPLFTVDTAYVQVTLSSGNRRDFLE
jgi:hypothetical protein